MPLVAPRVVLDVSCEARTNHQSYFLLPRAVFGEAGGCLLLLCAVYWTFQVRQGSITRVIFYCQAQYLVSLAFATRINHEIHFSWQWQYLVKLEGDSCCSAIVLDVSCEIRINHQSHFYCQGQYLVKLEGASCCSAHCTGLFMCCGLTLCNSG